jgi:hypothetical protein
MRFLFRSIVTAVLYIQQSTVGAKPVPTPFPMENYGWHADHSIQHHSYPPANVHHGDSAAFPLQSLTAPQEGQVIHPYGQSAPPFYHVQQQEHMTQHSSQPEPPFGQVDDWSSLFQEYPPTNNDHFHSGGSTSASFLPYGDNHGSLHNIIQTGQYDHSLDDHPFHSDLRGIDLYENPQLHHQPGGSHGGNSAASASSATGHHQNTPSLIYGANHLMNHYSDTMLSSIRSASNQMRSFPYPEEYQGDLDVLFRDLGLKNDVDMTPPPPNSPQHYLLSPQVISNHEMAALNQLYKNVHWSEFPRKYQDAAVSVLADAYKTRPESARQAAPKKVNWDMVCELLSGDRDQVEHALGLFRTRRLVAWSKDLTPAQRDAAVQKIVITFSLKSAKQGYVYLRLRDASRYDGIELLHARTKRDVLDISRGWKRQIQKKDRRPKRGEDHDEDSGNESGRFQDGVQLQ